MLKTAIIGFDSAWADNPKAPGAICAFLMDDDGAWSFSEPISANFDKAISYVQERELDSELTLVAIDQPTIVPNQRGCRPVDRIAGAVVGWAGGGVQPANRSKEALFGDTAPIWRFKAALNAIEDPAAAREQRRGLHLVEVFPALALPSLSTRFCGRNKGPRYNPRNTRQYRMQDWRAVIEVADDLGASFAINGLSAWCDQMLRLSRPSKVHQDHIDAIICALIGLHWLEMPESDNAMIGDLQQGYMITPVNSVTGERLRQQVGTGITPMNDERDSVSQVDEVPANVPLGDDARESKVVLTQVQIIQSLAEALAWFEKEISWGVAPAELNHLTGRIGELYAAMITRGQMALQTNQRGYDVISADNERISVKTVTSSRQVTFNPATFDQVDRVMILRINVDDDTGVSVETIADAPADEFVSADAPARPIVFRTNAASRQIRSLDQLRVTAEANFRDRLIRQYENGSVVVLIDGEVQPVAKPFLRKVAAAIGVDILNGSSQPKNTRQLGADIIKTLRAAGRTAQ